ncbi:MAG TPA: cupin domain-containing protein [Thermoanaerobaculia bacterium]|nr:cupin domain-containing protein [Thermoanaerobaculia bacterium]
MGDPDAVRVERWPRGDGAPTEKRMMRALELEGFDVLVTTYRPGTVFPEHEHPRPKCDAVLEGVLRVTVDGNAFDLGAGDRIYLPAGTRHAAEVVGQETVVSLDGTLW